MVHQSRNVSGTFPQIWHFKAHYVESVVKVPTKALFFYHILKIPVGRRQNSHIGPLTRGVGAIVVRKAKYKPLELSLPKKIVNQRCYCIPGGIAEITAIIKDLKDAGMVVPTTSSFNSPICQS